MKTQPHRNTGKHRELAHSPHWRRHPRYPSLSGDFEPFFPGNRSPRRRIPTKTRMSGSSTIENNSPQIPYVRVFALLAIIAIIAALLANA